MAFPTAVVCATDLSGRCDRAMDRAAQLARDWHARLVVVHALETAPELADGPRPRDLPSWRGMGDRAQRAIARVRRDLGEQFPDATAVVEEGDPAELVVQACGSHRAGLIVTGVARDELFGRRLLGGTVDALIRQVTVPLLVVRDRPRRPYGRIVVATDFSPASRRALRAGGVERGPRPGDDRDVVKPEGTSGQRRDDMNVATRLAGHVGHCVLLR